MTKLVSISILTSVITIFDVMLYLIFDIDDDRITEFVEMEFIMNDEEKTDQFVSDEVST